MGKYIIIFTRSARKELESFGVNLVNKIFSKIEALAEESRPKGCRKIQGEENLWRIRIGDYRVVYAVNDDRQEVDIIAIRHRKEIYRDL